MKTMKDHTRAKKLLEKLKNNEEHKSENDINTEKNNNEESLKTKEEKKN